MHRRFLFVFAAMLLPAAVWPQGVPLGPEFRINTYTTGPQRVSNVASDPSGNFLVVWNSDNQDGSGRGVFAQRFGPSGVPLGPELLVNTYTTFNQINPDVAADGAGNFIVVWSGSGPGGVFGVFGQRFGSSGAPAGAEFRVSTAGVTPFQVYPAVAAGLAGNFVVAWRTSFTTGSGYDVAAQRFDSAGAPLGSQFRVNSFTLNAQALPAVAADASGNFIVVWQSEAQDGSLSGIYGQRYAASGVALGPEFRVNTYVADRQVWPSVAMDPAGNFVVAWGSYGPDGSIYGVFAQRYASGGAPVGSEFQVNTFTANTQFRPDVATDAAGAFTVIWDSMTQDGSIDGIFGQRYAGSGAPLGPEFRANTFTASYQGHASVAADALGRFIVVWTSDLEDGSTLGVYGQRYDVIVPVELMRFRVE